MKKLKILVLEDSEERITAIKEVLKDHTIHIVSTPKDTIIQLCLANTASNPAYDLIFLDHDLELQEHKNDPYINNGMEVVRFILSNNFTPKNTNIVVHSFNIVSAPRMARELQEAGYTNTQRIPYMSDGWTRLIKEITKDE